MAPIVFFIKKLVLYRKELLISILLSLLLALSAIALLTLSGWFITSAAFAGLTVATAAAFNYFIPASMIRFLAFIRILSRYADRVVSHDFTFKILSALRVWFYQKLIPLAPANLITQRSGDLLNRIVHDIDTLDHLYLNMASPILIAFFLLLAASVFVACFSVLLAVYLFLSLSVFLTILCLITCRYTKKIGATIQMSMAALRIHTVDFIQGFTDLLLFVKKENRLSHIDQHNQALTHAQKKLALLKGFVISMMTLLSGMTVWIILIIGISLVRHNTITGAELAMIVFLIIVTFEQLLSLPFAFLSFGKTQHAAHRILEIAHQAPTVTFPEKTASLPSILTIVFQKVSFCYPNQTVPVLNNIQLSIATGDHIGITGASGAGKTTLMYLLTRIYDPTEGNITIGGIDLKNFSQADLRKMISFTPQHVHIFNASVRDNITLMQNTIPDETLFSILDKVDLLQHLKQLPDGLNTLMGEFGKNFSGGQIRRIAIARALLHNAPILIFDEPSIGLETALIERIWKNCENDFKNKTVIVITHDEKLLNCLGHRIDIHSKR